MSIDKEGFEIIDGALEADKAIQKEKREAELDEKYGKKKYTGAPTDSEDQQREDEKRQSELDKLHQEDNKKLEDLHFGEFTDRNTAKTIAEGNSRIEALKQKWRDRDKSDELTQRKEEGLSKEFNDNGQSI